MNKDAFHYLLYENEELVKPGTSGNKLSGYIIVHELQLSPSETSLLEKILKAIGSDLNAAKFIDLSHESLDWDNIQNAIILSFGPQLPGIGSFEKYTFQQQETNKYIIANSLQELSENQDFKLKLWAALKTL